MERIKGSFSWKVLSPERTEVKVKEFINLKQGNMSVEEYHLKFYMLSKYALFLVSDSRD